MHSSLIDADPPAADATDVCATEWNVADYVRHAIARWPDRVALSLSVGGAQRRLTFQELGALADRFVSGLSSLGLPGNARVLLLAPPTAEIYALALAVLDMGYALVTLDGRARSARIRRALRDANADIVMGASRVMRWWPLLAGLRRAIRFTVDGTMPGTRSLGELLDRRGGILTHRAHIDAIAPAVVSYSSGNTGLPKPVVRTHRVLAAQHRALMSEFPLPEGDVNLPGFPLAVLHNIARGTTTVLPDADLRSMADADVAAILRAIDRDGVTSLSGAPAFVGRIATALLSLGKTRTSVRRIVIGGGPVSRRLAADVLAAFPCADARLVYGATEAEPIATASLHEVLDAGDADEGYLVGASVHELEIRIVGAGERGELLVRGPHVAASSADGWHHTGDICRLDARGRLWLLGRIGSAVRCGDRLIDPFVVEARVNALRGIVASAFIAADEAAAPALFVEIAPGSDEQSLMTAARDAARRAGIASVAVLPIDRMPMDARHQSKVDRAAVARRFGGRA